MSAHNDADRKRHIERVQKCLNLSKSGEPHEAAAALRQAQKLMSAYGITEHDLQISEVEHITIETAEPYKAKIPMYMNYIVNLVQTAIGVKALYTPIWKDKGAVQCKLGVMFFGPKHRIELAEYTYRVVWRAIWASWSKYSKANPWMADQRGARTGFFIGWVNQVRAQVEAFGYVPKEAAAMDGAERNALVVKLDKEMSLINDAVAQFNPTESKTNKLTINGHTMDAGREAAKDFQLNQGVAGSKSGQLKLTHH